MIDYHHGITFKGWWEVKIKLCFDSNPHVELVRYVSCTRKNGSFSFLSASDVKINHLGQKVCCFDFYIKRYLNPHEPQNSLQHFICLWMRKFGSLTTDVEGNFWVIGTEPLI